MEMKREPVREFRRGHVLARIWLNPDQSLYGRYSVWIVRLKYRDEYVRATGAFNHDDLMDVRKVAFWAHLWIWWKGGSIPRRWKRK